MSLTEKAAKSCCARERGPPNDRSGKGTASGYRTRASPEGGREVSEPWAALREMDQDKVGKEGMRRKRGFV